jgi:L-asparaginase/Glu-tRNA(Gln) amidotransferase subunit D
MKIFVLNTGGAIGMVGKRPHRAKMGAELFEPASIRKTLKLTYANFGRPTDPTNITISDRIRVARAVAAAYEGHDGFLLLHEADGVVETCAMLSMVFKLSLQKPLIVVGSRTPADQPASDARMVLGQALDALDALHQLRLVGVYTVSNGEIWHGGRLQRRSASDHTVHTPGMWSLGTIWPRVDLAHGIYQRDFRFRDPALTSEGIQLVQSSKSALRYSRFLPISRLPCLSMRSVLVPLAVRSSRLKEAFLPENGTGIRFRGQTL